MPTHADIRSIELIVGLEVHVELATRSKMFSRCPSAAHPEAENAAPNTLIDPTVLGLPGALPVMNRAAVEMAMLVGLALNCRVASFSKWDRKSYFYPDLPKAYQISQYDLPLCADGAVDVPVLDEKGYLVPGAEPARIGIIRAHLEEDAGKLSHEAPGGGALDGSIIDYNRAGTPLLEIVTQPDFRSADRVVAFARVLRQLCRFLGVSGCDMQKGQMRFEPNINTRLTLEDGRTVRTPIAEIKNLNSFRALRGAIEHEHRHQPRRWLEDGIEQAPGTKRTLGWDDARCVTVLQREKEEAHDYRYFPDPDLAPVLVSDEWRADVQSRLPELPVARQLRYIEEEGLGPMEAAALVEDRSGCEFFERCVGLMAAAGVAPGRSVKVSANLCLQVGARLANERATRLAELGISPEQAAAVGVMRDAGELTSNAADELFAALCAPAMTGRDAGEVAAEFGLVTVRDEGQLAEWVRRAIAGNASAAADVAAGKQAAIGRIIGAVMKLSGGRADPKAAREKILEQLRR